uniref:Sodium/hydrogen exchanger n=1 Tax=Perkinsus olseni TaxID=32597 RepID=B6ZIU7_PEROL|nr:Na+/H+ antiporter [Perkinsus olseni]
MASLDDDASAYESVVSVNSVLFSAGLLLTFVWGYLVNTGRVKHISQSTGAVLIGFIMGIVVRLLGVADRKEMLGMSAELFYFALLPPIIFDASFSLNTNMFMSNLTSILTFAFIGTTISAYVTSIGLWTFSTSWLVGLKNTEALRGYCMTFGALISSTDPVAVMALMGGSKYRPNKTLHSLVFGESVLNDAVAIVLFAAYQQAYFSARGTSSGLAQSPLLLFLTVTFGSVIFGILSGALVSASYRKSSLVSYPKYEIAGMFLSIYLTFSLAELLGLSGIMAIFFFGLMLCRYNFHNLSKPSQVASKLVFETLAFFSETLVFLYLGVVACMSVGEYHWNLGLILFTLVLIVLARACNVFPLSWLLNHSTRYDPISRNSQIVLWLAGIRGAIAFVLMLRVPTRVGDDTRDLLVTTTISVVFVTTLVGGSLVEHVAVMLGELRPAAAPLPTQETSEPEITITDPSAIDPGLFYVPPAASSSRSAAGRVTLSTELGERLGGALEHVDRTYVQQHLGGAGVDSIGEGSHQRDAIRGEHPAEPGIDIDTYYEDSEAKRLMMGRAVVFE